MELTSLSMMFLTMTNTFDLPKGLLSSLCYVESHHNINAYHKDDGVSSSAGICQVKLQTAKMLGFKGSEKELMNPKINIYYAAKYLKKQLIRYNNKTDKAVAAYNAGSYKTNKQGLTLNHGYVKKVFTAWLKNK